jgi:tetratricopeptide (TPR) repeat protein
MRLLLCVCLGGSALYSQPSPESLLRDGHFKRARAIVEPKLAANPNDPELLYLMAWIKQEWKDLPAAQQLAERAVAADPKNSRYHLRLADAVGEEAQHASVLRQPGLGRRFKKEVDLALSLDPRNVDALSDVMGFYWMAPGIVGGDKTKARAILEQIAGIDPVRGYFAQVNMAQWEKQPERIEGLLRKAVETAPASFEARTTLGNFCLNSKKPEEAESHAREALRIDPTRVGGHALLAAVLAWQERWSDLEAALTEAERRVPDNLNPYYRAANVCISRGKEYARAEQYLRKYLGQEPEPVAPSHALAHWRMAVALEKDGRKPEAIAELQASLKLDPNSPAKADLKRLK